MSPAIWLVMCGGLQLAAVLAFFAMAAQVPEATGHAHSATVFVIFVYGGIRAGVGAILAFYGVWRWRAGYLSARRGLDLRIGKLWHDYSAATGLIAIAATMLLAALAGGARP